jgi:hypothetical protein
MIATAAQHKATAQMELDRFQFAAEKAPPVTIPAADTYQLRSYSIPGWAGPRAKGVLSKGLSR